VRHAAAMVRQGTNPAARVYESIGSSFFLALAPGWPNLRLWQGPGSEDEAEDACRRLVTTLAAALRLTAARLASPAGAPAGQQAAARLLLRQVDLLWRRQIIDYQLLRAVRP
jgi:hypothetical protein